MNKEPRICVLGIFVADAAFRAPRMPARGETLIGSEFALGPGGKGSNQAVAAARLGAPVDFVTRLGDDTFADMAMRLWRDAGVTPSALRDAQSQTGAACILIEEGTGANSIVVCPGAANLIDAAFVEKRRSVIEASSVFITQLEQPLAAAQAGLAIARRAGVVTVLNPAPAAAIPDSVLALADWVTPNETEAAMLTGIAVNDVESARAAAGALLARGAKNAVVTLGEKGALLHTKKESLHVPAVSAGPAVDTTGAGDAFNGGFAVALSRGLAPLEAVRFGCAVAGISVTRPGAAASMPTRKEAEALFRR